MIIFESDSPERTFALGERMGASLRCADVLVLVGDLGAGKTLFTKGVAKGNGLPDPALVTSPTFVFMNSYPGRVPIRHYDLYRMPEGQDIDALGFEDLRRDSAVLIEWGDRVPAVVLGPHVRMEFEVTGERSRRIRISGVGRSCDTLNLG